MLEKGAEAAGVLVYGKEYEAFTVREFGTSAKRVAEYIKGAPPPPNSKPGQPGRDVRQLLDDRRVQSEKSAGFAKNRHFGCLYVGGLIEIEKPVILFTACPHEPGEHGNVTATGFEEWARKIVHFDMRGRRITVRELYTERDMGSLTIIEKQPNEPPSQDIRSYHEFHDSGFFEHGTSFSYIIRNRHEEPSLHLCHLIGSLWSFLSHVRLFYRKIGMNGPFTVFLSVRNSSKLALGNYGDEMANRKRSPAQTLSLGHEPRTRRQHIHLPHAFGSVREMTDPAIADAARGMALKICSAYGQDASKCYNSDDGEFAWNLWECVSR